MSHIAVHSSVFVSYFTAASLIHNWMNYSGGSLHVIHLGSLAPLTWFCVLNVRGDHVLPITEASQHVLYLQVFCFFLGYSIIIVSLFLFSGDTSASTWRSLRGSSRAWNTLKSRGALIRGNNNKPAKWCSEIISKPRGRVSSSVKTHETEKQISTWEIQVLKKWLLIAQTQCVWMGAFSVTHSVGTLSCTHRLVLDNIFFVSVFV